METYQLNLGPLTRDLPLIRLNDDVTIASFVLLGDAQLTQYAASELAKLLQEMDFDYFVTMESKGIPLTQALSQITKRDRYIVLRKSVKDYMRTPMSTTVTSITTSQPQQLVLDGADAVQIRGRRVVIVDDVISSGESLRAATQLVTQAGAKVVDQLAILAEGEAADRPDVHYLAELPLF